MNIEDMNEEQQAAKVFHEDMAAFQIALKMAVASNAKYEKFRTQKPSLGANEHEVGSILDMVSEIIKTPDLSEITATVDQHAQRFTAMSTAFMTLAANADPVLLAAVVIELQKSIPPEDLANFELVELANTAVKTRKLFKNPDPDKSPGKVH